MFSKSIAVQLYTVRQAAAQDFVGTLERVASLGYTAVELAGTFNLSASELAQTLTHLGLQCSSAHVSLDELRQNLGQHLEYYQAIGAQFIVCPWLKPEERGGEAEYHALAEELNRIGEMCQVGGLQFCYHHHDFELIKFNGKYALDILLEESNPANLQLEADTYWLKFGGEDPAAYLSRWPGRVPLLHLKDMTVTQPPTFAEVGAGSLNWPKIFEAAQIAGVQWPIVEQDTCPGDPFESLQTSLKNLRQWLG